MAPAAVPNGTNGVSTTPGMNGGTNSGLSA